MSLQPSNYADDRARRIRAIGDRLRTLSDSGLHHLEAQLAMLDKVDPSPAPPPVERQIVQGAIVTPRPDLVAAAEGTLIAGDGRVVDLAAIGTMVYAGGGTVQAPEPDKAAEIAPVGGGPR